MSDLLHLLFYRLFTSPLKYYQVYTLLHNTSMQLNVILTPLCELLRYELVLKVKMVFLYVYKTPLKFLLVCPFPIVQLYKLTSNITPLCE